MLVTVLASGAMDLEGRGQQAPTFSAKREAVRVDVLVTEQGRAVEGLGASDFEVRDNGVAQQIDLVTFSEVPLDVILVFDASRSVAGDRLHDLQRAGDAVLQGLTSRDSAALVTFSHIVAVRQELTADIERVRRAIHAVSPGGRTALYDAMYVGTVVGGARTGRDLVIVFSDGQDTASWLTPDAVLESIGRSEATVYGVTVRGSGSAGVLGKVSDRTGGRTIEIAGTAELDQTFVAILDEFRRRYLLSYSPTGVDKAGWHRLDVRVKHRQAKVTARAGYQSGS